MSFLGKKFRDLHYQNMPLRLPNAWDAGSARLFEHLGASAVATTSAGMAWALGHQDGRWLAIRDVLAVVSRILRVITVPLSVDIEHGYADSPRDTAINVMRLAELGVAGINIEDGLNSPHILASKIERIRSLLNNNNLDMFINVRSDVFLKDLVDESKVVAESVTRGRLYRESGADGFFLPAIVREDHIEAIADEVKLPLNVMVWPHLPDAAKLGKLGVRRLSAGSSISTALWERAGRLAENFLATGSSSFLSETIMSYGALQSLFPEEDRDGFQGSCYFRAEG